MKKEEFAKKYNLEINSELLTDLDRVIVEELKKRGFHIITEEEINASKKLRIDPIKGTITEAK